MENRKWISNDLMFWQPDEWNRAFESCSKANPNFEGLSGTEKVNCMISWLMKEHPVPKELLDAQKAKFTH